MAEYTNSGLVKYCKEALKVKTVYMWGGLFREVTTDYINYLSGVPAYKRQYPDSRVKTLKSLVGKGYYGCDCIGLVKSYYFGGVGIKANAKGYDGSKDVGVGTMYNAAKIKGKIASMPKKEGVLVMTSDFGHVGVYIGGNEVIECTLSRFGDGVVRTYFNDRQWDYWCQCPFLTDDTDVETTTSNSVVAQYSTVNSIYRSVGVAAIRNKPSIVGTTVSKRCVKGDYYLADRLYLPDSNGQKWFRHAGQEKYSALTDTNGAALFEFCGTYNKTRSNAIVNIRSAPSLNGTKVARLSAGVTVYTTGKTSMADGITWVQLIYNGELYWCDRKWIDC